ncbi:MAG: hypothetical protein ACTSU2_03655 [Promethearchaeota archaeon]
MMQNKKVIITGMVIVLFIGIAAFSGVMGQGIPTMSKGRNLNINGNEDPNHIQQNYKEPNASTAHAAINLSSNAELDAFPDKSGSGTKEDPYIIENFTFPTDVKSAIYLENMDRYLIIRNCIFRSNYPFSSAFHVHLNNASNIVIENSIFRDMLCSFDLRVVEINNSKNIIARNNVFTNISTLHSYLFAFSIESNSEDITIENNNFTDFSSANNNLFIVYAGTSSEKINVFNNIATGLKSDAVIYINDFEGIDHANISNNQYSNNSALTVMGVYFKETTNCVFSNNTLLNQEVSFLYGIYLTKSTYVTISNNMLKGGTIGNAANLVLSFGTNHSKIFGNYIGGYLAYMTNYALYFDKDSRSNVVYLNYLTIGLKPVIDLGSNTYTAFAYFELTHRYQQVGNYYWNYTGNDSNHDYIGDTPYKIYDTYDYAPIVYGALDNDNDNLTNYEEEVYGTDPDECDTDGDGLSDWYEIKVLNTDPLKKDTDGDGILDDEDPYPLNSNLPSAGLFASLTTSQAIIISAIIFSTAIVVYAVISLVKTKMHYKYELQLIDRKKGIGTGKKGEKSIKKGKREEDI